MPSSVCPISCNRSTNAELNLTRFRVVLFGRPNVGKSRLLNALTQQSTAIVSNIAGTTRDYVAGRMERKGIQVEVVDTAGMDALSTHEQTIARDMHEIDRLSQSSSHHLVAESHLRVFCIDCSRPLDGQEEKIIREIENSMDH